MKKFFYQFIIIILTIYMVGCKTVWINSENPQTSDLGRYNHIFVGWLDFGRNNWEKFGYKSSEDWYGIIKELNRDFFQGAVKKLLPSKKLTFALSEVSTPEGADLTIQLTNINVLSTSPDATISTDINFIEPKTGRVVYKGNITTSSNVTIFNKSDLNLGGQGGTGTWRFENRLGYAVIRMANFIASKF